MVLAPLRTLGTHNHPMLDPAVLWTPSNDMALYKCCYYDYYYDSCIRQPQSLVVKIQLKIVLLYASMYGTGLRCNLSVLYHATKLISVKF